MKSTVQARVASRIKKILSQKGMSAEKLAFRIGMSKCYVYDFFNGKKVISLKSLQRIADGLNVQVEAFFRD
jgi:transcriptional regulator with XRE-family HTH domain